MLTEAPQRDVFMRSVDIRDGIQVAEAIFDPRLRAGLAAALVRAGVPIVEIGGFSSPKWEPRLTYTDQVAQILLADRSLDQYGAVLSAYCPNDKGVERAAESGIEVYNLHLAPTARFTQQLLGKHVLEPHEKIAEDMRVVRAKGGRATYYFTDAENILRDELIYLTKLALDNNVERVYGCDTLGDATVQSAKPWIEAMLEGAEGDASRLGLHLHNRGKRAKRVTLNAYREHKIRYHDATLGGRGLCPADRDKSDARHNGNLPLEAVVFAFEGRNIPTGIDRTMLSDASLLAQAMFAYADLDVDAMPHFEDSRPYAEAIPLA